jgi:predicted house-cleaning noncanonical NTP pyrophosphatase (MazG superfamily)
MEKIYNKLIRDKVPEIIEADNERPIYRVLSEEEYSVALLDKFHEELLELSSANNKEEIVKELSDLQELIRAYAEFNGMSLEEILESTDGRREKRGGFTKRIFLEKTILEDNN